MTIPEKQVRVFISSTFRDMHAERDHLVTVVFPELRERVESLGLEFFDVDLRWGVPEKGADGERANSWEYCKKWIDRVEPFFVSLLGQRYGYTPKPHDIKDDADRAAFADMSITEMEIRHAVLAGRLQRRSFFYLRKTRVSDQADASAKAEFVEEESKVERLKVLIKSGTRPVREYPCDWTGNGFCNLDDFGRMVLEDLWSGVLRDERYVSKDVWRQVLGEDFEKSNIFTDESQPVPRELWEKIVKLAKPEPKEPLDAEREQMEAFAAARLKWFQGRTKELEKLTEIINSTDEKAPRLAYVAAVPGQGKSALIAKLHQGISEWPREGTKGAKDSAQPEERLARSDAPYLITHFVGATERSASTHALVERLLGELDRSGIAWPADEQKEGEEPKRDFNSLCLRLAKRLGDYAGERRIVILLDALNQLSDGHDLVWLPHRLGPGVRVVVSCITEETGAGVQASACSPGLPATSAPDSLKAGLQPPTGGTPAATPEQRVMAALKRRQPSPLRVPLGPLTEEDVRTIVVAYLKEYCHELDREHLDTLCAIPQARNPLYLLVMLNELRTLGGNDLNRIVPALIAEMPQKHPDTVSLFRWVLQRLEVFGAEAVRWWCLYLAHGRVGMASHELADLLARKLGADATATALRIERGLRRYLQRRGPQLDFFHGQLRQAVYEEYNSQTEASTAHADMAFFFNYAERTGQPWQGAPSRSLKEFPYHLWQSGVKEPLFDLARNESFLSAQNMGLSEDPDLPFRTLRMALDAACGAENPVAMAEFTLAHAYRLRQQQAANPLDVLLTPIMPPDVALQRAWGLADLLEPELRAYALLVMAWKLQVLNKAELARITLARVNTRNSPKFEALNDLALVVIGSLNQVEGINLEDLASSLLWNEDSIYKLVILQSAARRFPMALATAKRIHNPWLLAHGLNAIGVAQAKDGIDPASTFETARDAVARIDDDSLRKSGLEELTQAQAQCGLFVNAFSVAEMIDGWPRERAFSAIALAQAQHGEIENALTTAAHTGSYWTRLETLLGIAQQERQIGRDTTRTLALATQLARSINVDPTHRNPQPLLKVIRTLACFGEITSAASLADEISSLETRAIALTAIAQAEARSDGNAEPFFSAAELCVVKMEGRNIPEALARVAAARAEVGQDPVPTFISARKAANGIYDNIHRVDALRKLVTAQATARLFDAALETAQAIAKDSKGGYEEALKGIASVQAEAGQSEAALRTHRMIGDNFLGRQTLANGVCPGLAKAGRFSEALSVAFEMRFTVDRTDALSAIAVSQAEAGEFVGAASTASLIEGRYHHAVTLSKIVRLELTAGRDPTMTFAAALNQTSPSHGSFCCCLALASIASVGRNCASGSETILSHATRHSEQVFEPDRTKAFQMIAEAWTCIGRVESATQLIIRIPSVRDRIYCLTRIASIEKRMGRDPSATISLAIELAEQERADTHWDIIAVSFADRGQFEFALDATRRITDNDLRIGALCSVAQAQALVGLDTRPTFEAARGALPIPYGLPLMQEDIRDRRQSLGDLIAESENIVKRINSSLVAGDEAGMFRIKDQDCGQGWISVAAILSNMGRLDPALAAASRIVDAKERAIALRKIAQAQARKGEDNAVTLAAAIAIEDRSSLPAFLFGAAYHSDSAYTACSVLAHLFPASFTSIAKVLGVDATTAS